MTNKNIVLDRSVKLKPGLTEILDFLDKNHEIPQEEKFYFKLRAEEFMHIIKTGIFDVERLESCLEIGCGNGFISALLSRYCGKVLSIDLPERRDLSHSKGLVLAKKLVGMLGLKNVEIKGGQAEDIPSSDNSIDFIYSHFVFEHILDYGAAFKEINRVLRDDGVMITIVPNALNRIIWLKRYGLSRRLIKNYLRPLYNILWKKTTLRESFRDFYWTVPPHDRRLTFWQELRRYRINNWKRIFNDNCHRIDKIISIRKDASAFFTQKVN